MTKGPVMKFEDFGEITVATIRAAKVLDALNVTEFGQEVLEYVKDHPETHMLIDFQYVHYLSSAVLTELLRIKEALETKKGALRLCNLNADIRRVFEITNLDQVFIIYDGDTEACVERYKRALQLEAEEEAWFKKPE